MRAPVVLTPRAGRRARSGCRGRRGFRETPSRGFAGRRGLVAAAACLPAVIAGACVLPGLAGCGGGNGSLHRSEAPLRSRTVDAGDVRVTLSVPATEPLSVGTYRLEVREAGTLPQVIEGSRDGVVNDVWLADLEGNAEPEIVVTMTSAGSGSYGTVHVYRREAGRFVRRPLAPLPEIPGYMGHDEFSVAGGLLKRRFPLYAPGDPNAAPSRDSVELIYSFAEEGWTGE